MQEFINQIKRQGFKVYAPETLTSYVYFTDGERIGYAQISRFDGCSFSTVHKPNTTTGTGYKVESIEEALSFAPAWGRGTAHSVKKYASWNEFATKHWQPLIEY